MKLADFYAYTEQTFDSFCKQVIRNERKLSLTAHPRHELYQAVTHQISPTHAPVRR